MRVDGGDEVTFFIDTGGSEVALDTEFAKELGLPQFGEMQGTFSGGEHANVQQSRIESLNVGDWTIKNLPIVTLALRQLSEGLGVKRIDGCIGTNLLYHFLATLDFPHGELVLRRKTAKSLKQFAAGLSFGDIQEDNVAGLYDGPFRWENTFGFHLAGVVGHDFFKPYAVTFDFETMQIFLR